MTPVEKACEILVHSDIKGHAGKFHHDGKFYSLVGALYIIYTGENLNIKVPSEEINNIFQQNNILSSDQSWFYDLETYWQQYNCESESTRFRMKNFCEIVPSFEEWYTNLKRVEFKSIRFQDERLYDSLLVVNPYSDADSYHQCRAFAEALYQILSINNRTNISNLEVSVIWNSMLKYIDPDKVHCYVDPDIYIGCEMIDYYLKTYGDVSLTHVFNNLPPNHDIYHSAEYRIIRVKS